MSQSLVLPTAADVVAADLDFIAASAAPAFEALAGRRLLITGGAGFLGYSLVQAALHAQRGSPHPTEVVVFDNFVRGGGQWLRDLAACEPCLKLVRHSLIEPLPESMPAFDYVIHAAGIASPTFYRRHPLETMDANINGLRALLEYARASQATANPVRGLLFFSSSEIYGDPPPEQIPTAEDYRGNVSCTGPRACYDESKRYGETLCTVFAQQYGVPVTMARPFNNYGPGLKISDRRVIPDFARDILANRPIRILSDGSPKRTFCYVADAAAGYFRTLVLGRPGEAYNIGAERPEVTMRELAENLVRIARDVLGYAHGVECAASTEAAYLVDNPQRRCPDLTKSRRELGYAPQVDLDDGLRRTLLWYRQNSRDEEG